MAKNYMSTFNGRANYTPAISAGYAIATLKSSSSYRGGNVPVQPKDLDFLDPGNPLFFYPYALLSVGQFWSQSATVPPNMCTKPRAAQTVVIGDSAGFQTSAGLLAGNKSDCNISLRKQELVADRIHILDVPLFAIDNSNNSYSSYQACRNQTNQNAQYFDSHKTLPCQTVEQGRNWEELVDWYETVVRPLPMEGISFAGECAHKKPDLIFRIVLKMISDKLFDHWDHVHWLGRATLGRGVMLSMFKRKLSEFLGKDITVTYDTSTPMTTAMTQYTIFTFPNFANGNLRVGTESLLARYLMNGAPGPFPFPSEIGKVLALQDVCVPEKARSSSWDTYGTLLGANHNLDVFLEALDQAHKLCDLELTLKDQLGRKEYNIARQSSQRLVPKSLVEADYIITEIFRLQSTGGDPDAFLRRPDIYRHLRNC